MVRDGEADIVWKGWMGIAFFGACALFYAWQLVDSQPRLVIDDQGILDRTLGVGLIPWSEITGAYLRSAYGQSFICLETRNHKRWLERMSPVKRAMTYGNKMLGYPALILNLAATGADTSQVLELILKTIASVRQNHG